MDKIAVYKMKRRSIIPLPTSCFRLTGIAYTNTGTLPSSITVTLNNCDNQEISPKVVSQGTSTTENICINVESINTNLVDLTTIPITSFEVEDAILNNSGEIIRFITDGLDPPGLLGNVVFTFTECV